MVPENELTFRIAFGLLWLVYFIVRIYFQRRVKGMGAYEHVNEHQEKLFFRLFALAYLLLAFYFLTPWVDFAHLAFSDALRWIGALITLLGIALFGWAHYELGLNWTAILALSAKHNLVTGGPYRYIRHPMYTSFYVIGLGFLLLSANWFVNLIYFVTLTLMYIVRVKKEEEMMLNRFGEKYSKYMQTTGRLLPRI